MQACKHTVNIDNSIPDSQYTISQSLQKPFILINEVKDVLDQ